MSKIYLESGVYIVELEDYDGSSITNMRVAEASAPNTWYTFGSVALESPNPQWDGAYVGTHDHKFVGFGANEAPWAGNNFIIFTPTGLAPDQSITTDSLLLSGDWGSLYNQTGFVATDVKHELAYRLEGIWNFAPGDASDVFGGNHGTANGVLFGAAAGRTFASFDGVDDYISIPHDASIDFGTDFSVSMWVNTTQTSKGTLFQKYNGTSGTDPSILTLFVNYDGTEAGKARFGYRNSNNVYKYATSTTSINDGSWHHVTMQLQGTEMKLYIDGALEATTTGVASGSFTSSEPIHLGRWYKPWSGEVEAFYMGAMDEVNIWSRALTADQVATIYSSENVLPTPETTLVGHWSFDNGDATADVGTDGSASAGVVFESDSGRTVASFNGSSHVSIPHAADNTMGEQQTVAMWIKTSQTSLSNTFFKGYGGNDSIWQIIVNNSGAQNKASFRLRNDAANSDKILNSTTDINDGAYHHIATVRDGENVYLYIDGALEDSASGFTGSFSASEPLFLGAWDHPSYAMDQYFNGSMDDIRIYEMALDASQVSDLYNATIVTPVADPTISIASNTAEIDLASEIVPTIELNGNSLDAPGNGAVFVWQWNYDIISNQFGVAWNEYHSGDAPFNLEPTPDYMSNVSFRAGIKVNGVYYYSNEITMPDLMPTIVIDNDPASLSLGDTVTVTIDLKGAVIGNFSWYSNSDWVGKDPSGYVIAASDTQKVITAEMQLHRSGNIYDGMGTYTANITVPDLAANLVPVQKNGYYPLFLTEAEANLWSAGNGSSHTHEFGGVTYYMPNGLTLGVDQFHGDYQLAVQYSMDDATGLNAFNGATFGESAEGRIAASLPNGDSGMYPDSPIALGSQYTLSLWFKNLRDRSQAPAGAMQFDGTHNGGVHNGSFNGTGATAASYNIFIYTNDELGAWSSASSWRSSGYTMTHLTHAGWHHLAASYDNGTMTY